MSLLNRLKDQAVSATARQLINSHLKPYGSMLNFSVQTDTKTLNAEIQLKGEASPIRLTLTGYEIGGTAEKPTLRFAKTAASREWLDTVLREFVEGKAIDLPPKAAPLLKMLL